MINILAVSLRCGISLPAHKYHSLCSEAETAARERTNGPRTARAGSKNMARAFLLAAATLACAAALAPPKTHVAPVSAGPVPAAVAAAVPAIAAQPASAAILGIKAPLLGQAGVVFAPVLLVAVPIVLIVIGNGAIQQVKRVLSGEGQKYSQNEN